MNGDSSGRVLQILDRSPIQLLFLLAVMPRSRSRIEVAIMITTNDDDVGKAAFYQVSVNRLQPVNLPLKFSQGAQVGEITGVDEQISRRKKIKRILAVRVRYADDFDRLHIRRWRIRRTAEVQKYAVGDVKEES